jgi:O-antigen ligase
LGIVLLILTFSRSAWLGLIVFVAVLALKSKYFEQKKLILLVSTIIITAMCTLYPLRELAAARTGNQTVKTEEISSVGRSWLSQQAIRMIQKHPVAGVGVGSFILELSKTAVRGAPIEPVHNLLLLISDELGVAGLILILVLISSIAVKIFQAKSPQAVLAGAMVTGIGAISLFDHYLWTLAPGRIMLGLVLGLWAGQAANHA